MEHEGSLPHSQQYPIGHYPEPDVSRSSPVPDYLLQIYVNIIIVSSTLTPSKWFLSRIVPIIALYESPFSPYLLHAPPISLISSLESEYINGQNNINDTDSRLQYRWYSHSHKLSLTHSSDTTEPNGTRYNAGHKQFNELIISNDTTLIAVTNPFLAPSSYLLFSAPDSYVCM